MAIDHPSDVPDCVCVLEPETLLTDYDNGDPVNVWRDTSGLNNHATQGVASAQPAFVAAQAEHGWPAIRTGIVGGTGRFINLPALWSGETEGEAFVVVKTDAYPPAASSATGLWRIGSGQTAHYPFTDGHIYENAFCNTRFTKTSPPALNTTRIYAVSNDPVEGWKMRMDGAVLLSVAPTVAFSPAPASHLGANGAAGQFLLGHIFAFVAFTRRLEAAERLDVFAWLARIQASPPSVAVSLAVVNYHTIEATLSGDPADVISFELHRGAVGFTISAGSLIASWAGDSLPATYTDDDLRSNIEYQYLLRAVKASENVDSSRVSATTNTLPFLFGRGEFGLIHRDSFARANQEGWGDDYANQVGTSIVDGWGRLTGESAAVGRADLGDYISQFGSVAIQFDWRARNNAAGLVDCFFYFNKQASQTGTLREHIEASAGINGIAWHGHAPLGQVLSGGPDTWGDNGEGHNRISFVGGLLEVWKPDGVVGASPTISITPTETPAAGIVAFAVALARIMEIRDLRIYKNYTIKYHGIPAGHTIYLTTGSTAAGGGYNIIAQGTPDVNGDVTLTVKILSGLQGYPFIGIAKHLLKLDGSPGGVGPDSTYVINENPENGIWGGDEWYFTQQPESPIEFITPAGGEVLTGVFDVTWTPGTGQDSYELEHWNGSAWIPVATPVAELHAWNTDPLPSQNDAQLRVRGVKFDLVSNWTYSELFDILHPIPVEEPDLAIPPAVVEEFPVLAELRLGPLQTPVDLSMAHNEEQDKINELIRAVNQLLDWVRGRVD